MFKLATKDVHLWSVDLSVSSNDLAPFKHILSELELEKVGRFIHLQHQQRAYAMKLQLRLLLSCYLNVLPASIEFKNGQYGKPYLAKYSLNFNISHSADTALVVISRLDNVGVDIEYWRPLAALSGLVERTFSTNEIEQWQTADESVREHVFFDLWAKKEAFIKATGRGLGLGLKRCSFTLQGKSKLLECPVEFGSADEWSCWQLKTPAKTSASLVVKAKHISLQQRTFSLDTYLSLAQSL